MRTVDTSTKLLARAFARWWWLLVVSAIVGYFVGKILLALLPPTYQSTAVVQLSTQTRSSQAQIIQPIAAYSTLVTSDPVLNPVLAQHREIDRQTFVAKQLVITSDTPSQSFQIQVTLPQARTAADIANTLARTLVSQQNAYIKAQYDTSIKLANSHIADEQKVIDRLNQQYAATLPTNTVVLAQLDSQIQQQRNLQNTDVLNLQSLTTEAALFDSPFSIAQSATVATKPSSFLGQIPFVPVMIALLIALGVVAITLLEQNAGRINSTYDLQRKVVAPVVGSLRWTTPVSPAQLCENNSDFVEDCRVMMADMLLLAEGTKARLITLMGIRAGAGTSSVIAYLGALLAQSQRRVLLIDANLYHPTLHEQLDVANEAGLAMLLEEARKAKVAAVNTKSSTVDLVDHLMIDRFVKPTSVPNLYLIPAGETHDNPGDLLSIPELRDVLQWAVKPGDLVLVDSPSLEHGDAHVLGAISDQTLVVVDATRDLMKQVEHTKEELAHTGGKLSGLIVNKLGRWI
ncbi:MAG TPA: cellulose synthase operon protein YhjQ/BcsQ [Ktedonobacteraceae bacterium]|nr:cellulose synthase operon protein YhjQ/BcsQ [Ktedonobacteraceae bacterium]